MVAINPNQIAHQVQERLNRAGSHASHVRVLADQLRLEPGPDGGFWYVPVSNMQDEHNAYRYYEAFSEIEEALESENVSILLVPRIIHQPDA